MTNREVHVRGGRIEAADPDFGYMPGFGNHHSTEAEAGALPIGRNSPQRPPLGLYAEQLSGTLLHRAAGGEPPLMALPDPALGEARPGVRGGGRGPDPDRALPREQPPDHAASLGPPTPIPAGGRTDFLSGLRTIATCGDAAMQAGMASHVYAADASMDRRYFQNADGELLVAPQHRRIRFLTELGILVAEPGEIVVIPRGVKFRVDLVDGPIRGYVCENYGAALTLPERGPIGANGLANERDFLYPAAAYEDVEEECELYCKTRGRMFRAVLPHSPLDVVAWHGNDAPLQVRPAAVLAGRRNPLRSPGPVDLHRAHRPLGHAGRRERRLRHLSGALARDGG